MLSLLKIAQMAIGYLIINQKLEHEFLFSII